MQWRARKRKRTGSSSHICTKGWPIITPSWTEKAAEFGSHLGVRAAPLWDCSADIHGLEKQLEKVTSHYLAPLTTLVTTELHRNYDIAEQRGGWQMKFSRPKSKQATYYCSVCSSEERRETRVNFAVRFKLIISFPLVRKRIDLNDAQQKIVRPDG